MASLALLGPFARTPEQRPAFLDIRERAAADFAVPAQLRSAIVPVRLQPGARFGNYLGGLVNRIDGRRGRPDAAPASRPGSVGASRARGRPAAAQHPVLEQPQLRALRRLEQVGAQRALLDVEAVLAAPRARSGS